VADEVATYLNNRKRRELARLEDEGHMTVRILGAKGVFPEHLAVQCRDAEDREVRFPRA
jgi:ribonuclease E